MKELNDMSKQELERYAIELQNKIDKLREELGFLEDQMDEVDELLNND